MILELDFASKTIKVKGTIKVSDLMDKITEMNLGDWSVIQQIEYINYPSYPLWWETRPYYENPTYVGDVDLSNTNNNNIPCTLTSNNC